MVALELGISNLLYHRVAIRKLLPSLSIHTASALTRIKSHFLSLHIPPFPKYLLANPDEEDSQLVEIPNSTQTCHQSPINRTDSFWSILIEASGVWSVAGQCHSDKRGAADEDGEGLCRGTNYDTVISLVAFELGRICFGSLAYWDGMKVRRRSHMTWLKGLWLGGGP